MITGWLTRVTVMLAVIAVIAFDGVSVVAAHLRASDDAQTAALAAADAYHQQGTIDAAKAAAKQNLSKGESLVPGSLRVARDGEVDLTIHKTARSLVLHLFSATKSWAIVTESGSGMPPS